MKKVFLLIVAAALILSFSCKDNVMETLDEPQEQVQEESGEGESPEEILKIPKVLFSVDISKVINLKNKTIQPDNLIDLVLFVITQDKKVPVAIWTNYTEMKESVFSIPKFPAGSCEFELQGSYKGKNYRGIASAQIQNDIENKLSFELFEISSTHTTDKCRVLMDINVQELYDIPVVYNQGSFYVQFTTTHENANWYVDSKKIAEGTSTFTFYPRTLDSETYTITVTDETDCYLSTNIFIQISIPVDFRIASTEFYDTIAGLDSSQLKDIYYINFTDSNPDLYEIARTLNAFENINFALDFTECIQLTELPYKVPDPKKPDDEEAQLIFVAERSNVYGLRFGDGDITVHSHSIQFMPNLEYLTFGNGNNTIQGSAMRYGQPTPLKYLLFGDGNNTLESCSFPSDLFEFISFGNGNNTLNSAAFITNSESPIDCYMYFGAGNTVIFDSSLPDNRLHLFFADGKRTIGEVGYNCRNIIEINIGNGDTVLNGNAFRYSKNLKNVSIGDGNLKIAGYGFSDCSIDKLVLGNGDKTFDFGAFGNSLIKEIDLKDGNVSAQSMAFAYLQNLVSFKMGDGDFIAEGASTFYNDPSLEEVSFGNGKHILTGSTAFGQTHSLKTVTMGDGDTIFGPTCFFGASNLETVKLGKGDIQVQSCAFVECKNLKSFIAEDGVSKIEQDGFNNCISLEHIRLNKNFTELKYRTFINCFNLTFTVDEDNPAFTTEDNGRCLMNKEKTIIYHWSATGDVVFPENVSFPEIFSFSKNTNITSITLSHTIDYFGAFFIDGCTSLETFILPDPERWYYTTTLEDAQNKTNGTSIETDEHGAVNSSLLNKLIHTSDNHEYFYFYKSEANDD